MMTAARVIAGGQSLLRRWGEMIKFSHSVFALPFALMATFLAARSAYEAGAALHVWPAWDQLALIVICMVAARSAAMTFNRITDAACDARNPRTAVRAIPAGTITVRQAAAFLLVAVLVFEAACAGFWWRYGNVWPLGLSLPVLSYLGFYSYTKRFTKWSHFVLGSAIALSPVAAWLAIHPASLGWPAVVLMAAVTLWIGGFDIIYACQDVGFDRAEGLHSLPARWGVAGALWAARIAHAGTVLLLAGLVPLAGLGWLYGLGVGIVAILLVIENALVRADDLSRVNVVFFTVNGAISLVLGGLTIADVLVR
ncbi:MAG TPA: UbiA-like polyprenyltransferase [Phycisphaerae bacterium]|nr:UbiA-like polyprenyltransferase [Phycisphaerae bacterium]